MNGLIFGMILAVVFVAIWNYLTRKPNPRAKLGPDGTNIRNPESFVVHHEGKGQGLDIANTALKERTENLTKELPGDAQTLNTRIPGRDLARIDARPSAGRVVPLRGVVANSEQAIEFHPDASLNEAVGGPFDWSAPETVSPTAFMDKEDEVVAMVRNPRSLYVYWDLNGFAEQNLQAMLGHDRWAKTTPCLRLFDLSSGACPDQDGGHTATIELQTQDDHCFVNEGIAPGHRYVVSFERRTAEGQYYMLSHSDAVQMPPASH